MASVTDAADSLNQINILHVSSRLRCFLYAAMNIADSGFNLSYGFSFNCYGEFFWLQQRRVLWTNNDFYDLSYLRLLVSAGGGLSFTSFALTSFLNG